jgi:hypothetical protein
MGILDVEVAVRRLAGRGGKVIGAVPGHDGLDGAGVARSFVTPELGHVARRSHHAGELPARGVPPGADAVGVDVVADGVGRRERMAVFTSFKGSGKVASPMIRYSIAATR